MKSLKLISLALSMLVCFVTFAQEKTITGTVTDETGPLPGVNISIQKSTTVAATNFDGKYSIQAKKGDVLVFSYIGYTTQKKVVGDKNVINVKLIGSQQHLEEVVVVGYGVQKKKSVSYSVASVSQSGQGTAIAPIVQNNTQYVASPKVVIRGAESISSKNEPYILLTELP